MTIVCARLRSSTAVCFRCIRAPSISPASPLPSIRTPRSGFTPKVGVHRRKKEKKSENQREVAIAKPLTKLLAQNGTSTCDET